MITFEKISDVHYKAFKYELFLNSIEVHSDKYVIRNRYSVLSVPKRFKRQLKQIILYTYLQDLKSFKFNEYCENQTEGFLSIKKMKDYLIKKENA
tara:strand:+ start:160 stop:444 length:285 start_codon:yes stop_codon:yes gene_type:complete